MATAEPSLPSFVVLGNVVRDYNRIHDRGDQKWATVRCESKHAYISAEYGQSVVDGLTLFVRFDDAAAAGDRYHDLAISATEDALGLLGAEVPDDVAEYAGRELSLLSYVKDVVDEKNLIIFAVSFSTSGEYRDFSLYFYLVYDSSAASLFMIRSLPTHCTPLPVRCGNDDLDLLMASLYQRPDVLCLWSPLLSSYGTGGDPWQAKDRRLPENFPRDGFRVDKVFSFKGKAFWADLSRGVLYCDCAALLNPAAAVDFRFIELPQGYRLHDYLQIMHMMPIKLSRTMGAVGDSIWFVSVGDQSNSNHIDAGDTMVKVWTLDLSMEEWNMYSEFRLGDLWKLEDFKKAKMRKVVPEWPILREQDDGVLYFVLPRKPPMSMNVVPKGHNYVCGVDMRHEINANSLVLSRPLSVSCIMVEPIVLPSNLFKHLDPVPSRKRKALAVV